MKIKYLHLLHQTLDCDIESNVSIILNVFGELRFSDAEKLIEALDEYGLLNYKDIIVMVCL